MSVDVKVATERAHARIGSVIKDKWRLDRLLGVGGMACVYAATHRNNKRAALKLLHREFSNDTAIRERFLREGYLANSVGHRGVVLVDDDDVAEDGAAFLVMELLDGETLEQRWRRKGQRLPLEEVLAVADQVLDALAAAHDNGVVHRDLKPENLFLNRDGVVKLLDFGIGGLVERQGGTTSTLSGAAMGTPAFMAPEQARGRWHEVNGQTDLWAMGATMFTLLTGEYVHEGETVNETLAMAVTQSARSLKTLRADLPERATALVDTALRYAKAERFADARAMQAEVRLLYAALSGQDVSQAAQLSVPDWGPPASGPSSAGDPRRFLTTGRAVSAAHSPASAGARSGRAGASSRGRPWAWGLVGLATLGLLGWLAFSGGLGQGSAATTSGRLAGAAPSSGGEQLEPPPVAVAAPNFEPAPAPPEQASAVPRVSIEQLPRERRRKIARPAR